VVFRGKGSEGKEAPDGPGGPSGDFLGRIGPMDEHTFVEDACAAVCDRLREENTILKQQLGVCQLEIDRLNCQNSRLLKDLATALRGARGVRAIID